MRYQFRLEIIVKPLISVLNGPNLNLLGKRQPDIYGSETLRDIERKMLGRAEQLGLSLEFFQSNHEGALIDKIHEARDRAQGIVINPAAYSHTSVALLDALNTFAPPVVEVHISNIHRRESFRHHSLVSSRAEGVIAGLGTLGYLLALEYFVSCH